MTDITDIFGRPIVVRRVDGSIFVGVEGELIELTPAEAMQLAHDLLTDPGRDVS